MSLIHQTPTFPPTLTPEPTLPGQIASTQLEINNNAVNAGRLEPQSLSLIESALPPVEQSTLFSHLKTWFHAILETTAVAVVTLLKHGTLSRPQVWLVIHASHTVLETVLHQLAKVHAVMVPIGLRTRQLT